MVRQLRVALASVSDVAPEANRLHAKIEDTTDPDVTFVHIAGDALIDCSTHRDGKEAYLDLRSHADVRALAFALLRASERPVREIATT
jgi:hypothetical protein